MPLESAELVVAFLPRRHFNLVPPLFPMRFPLSHYIDLVQGWFYAASSDDEGWVPDSLEIGDWRIEYIIAIIQAIGIGTADRCVQLLSILRPPFDDSCGLVLSDMAAEYLNHALWRLEGHLQFCSAASVMPADLARDFARLRDILDQNGELYEVNAAALVDEVEFARVVQTDRRVVPPRWESRE